ncbi:hypothetical protein CXF72_11975 [Psychromonas sp. MB-3u-54]|nr:hypothetical protein CXF72_11975 [Psychromonas sp. MB-3u-54]
MSAKITAKMPQESADRRCFNGLPDMKHGLRLKGSLINTLLVRFRLNRFNCSDNTFFMFFLEQFTYPYGYRLIAPEFCEIKSLIK